MSCNDDVVAKLSMEEAVELAKRTLEQAGIPYREEPCTSVPEKIIDPSQFDEQPAVKKVMATKALPVKAPGPRVIEVSGVRRFGTRNAVIARSPSTQHSVRLVERVPDEGLLVKVKAKLREQVVLKSGCPKRKKVHNSD